jgi:hypothetical protein
MYDVYCIIVPYNCVPCKPAFARRVDICCDNITLDENTQTLVSKTYQLYHDTSTSTYKICIYKCKDMLMHTHIPLSGALHEQSTRNFDPKQVKSPTI